MSPRAALSPSVDHAREVMGSLLLGWANRALWSEAQVGRSWGAIAEMPLRKFIDHASPFLMQRLGALAAAPEDPDSEDHRIVLALAADSLLPHARNAECVRLPEGSPLTLTLPVCGQVLTLGPGAASLAPSSDRRTLTASGDAALKADPDTVRFIDDTLAESECAFTVTVTQDPILFDQMARSRMAPGSERPMLDASGILLRDTIRFIGSVDRPLSEVISRDVSCYSLIGGTEQVQNSFSISGLKGVVFLSLCQSCARLAERIIHEYGHSQLYALAELDPLTLPNRDRVYCSPWRPDARPINGLFHALYVFENVAHFLQLLAATGNGTSETDVAERLAFLNLQLCVAIGQIERSGLTGCGREIVNLIIGSMNERKAASNLDGGRGLGWLRTHFTTWRASNGPVCDAPDIPSLAAAGMAVLGRGEL
jgi:HEXXH motif-containing protein